MTIAVSLQRRVNVALFSLVLVAISSLASRCEAQDVPSVPMMELTVTASAYNSLYGQGAGSDHALAAWGDRLKPCMQVIAVSRDLISMGLTHNVEVTIEGLPGVWQVKDKMHRRWKRKIDIYMGEDLQAAREWGRRKVKIRFPRPKE
ncbi:hypothetical protein [Alcanivorax sp.]|jgi:3D (Asp-Asp-Asp) domain-containing protein|uniref:3D domain-containing protein n=1 Tax=Alcanivorax TaxID=59753 RepID=UPI0025847FC3|nr:hypothetical protein [Alcanivorax sp.]